LVLVGLMLSARSALAGEFSPGALMRPTGDFLFWSPFSPFNFTATLRAMIAGSSLSDLRQTRSTISVGRANLTRGVAVRILDDTGWMLWGAVHGSPDELARCFGHRLIRRRIAA
jgi:hypothetical protein